MEVLTSEVARYLGYRGAEPDARVSSLVKELNAEFSAKTAPKSVYGIWTCRVDSSSVALPDITIMSKSLAKRLENCSRAVLLAATLGPEADTLIRRYSVQDMEKAVIAQAVCAAMIEVYCDKVEGDIAKESGLCGLCAAERFSPGYGDFDMAHQKDIVNLLNCDRKIGLALTSGYMLVPSKSLTAVIGFGGENTKNTGSCEDCSVKQCLFS